MSEDLCDDEGCPHFGTPHVCVSVPGVDQILNVWDHGPAIKAELEAAGYVIVPKTPTDAMCEAGGRFHHDNWRPGHAREDTNAASIWRAMVEAV